MATPSCLSGLSKFLRRENGVWRLRRCVTRPFPTRAAASTRRYPMELRGSGGLLARARPPGGNKLDDYLKRHDSAR